MISRIVTAAAALAVTAGFAAAPAAAAMPGAPAASLRTAIEMNTPGADNGRLVPARHLRRGSPRCRTWRRRARRSRYYGRLWRRHCVQRPFYRHRVSRRVCNRWRFLGFRRGVRAYRVLWRRHCRR